MRVEISMRTKYFVLLLMVVCLSSCQKKYKYVEEVIESSIFGEEIRSDREPENVSAMNDTLAYLEAFQKYCISQKVYEEFVKRGTGQYMDKPSGFRLYNSDGVDISDISFVSRSDEEKKIVERVWNTLSNALAPNDKNNQTSVKIDSAKIEELLPFFNINKDEFDPKKGAWYKPKSAPKYVDCNAVYLYFKADTSGVSNLFFKVQYYAEDLLSIRKMVFAIDSNVYEYYPIDVESDYGYGKIWEWSNEYLTDKDKELIYSLSNAKSAKIKFVGRQYSEVRTITKQQILDIKRTLDLYNAMGGDY